MQQIVELSESPDTILRRLLPWAGREGWREQLDATINDHFEPVCQDLGIERDRLKPTLGRREYQVALSCAIEDFLTRRFEPGGRNVIEAYLKTDGKDDPASSRHYLESLRESVVSLYEVLEVEPAGRVVLKDLVRGGDPIEIQDRLAATFLYQWDRLAARVLNADGIGLLSPTVLPFTFEAAQKTLESLEDISKLTQAGRGEAGDPDKVAETSADLVANLLLADATRKLTHIWMTDRARPAARKLAEIPTSEAELAADTAEDAAPVPDDGTSFFAETRLTLTGAAAAIAERLDQSPEFARNAAKDRGWSWIGAGDDGSAEESVDSTILGLLELTEDELVLRSNAALRSRQGAGLLAGLLEGLIVPPEMPAPGTASRFTPAPFETDEDDDEEARRVKFVKAFTDRHYLGCLDTRLPMIGGITPRDAARSEAGRAKVVDWLKYLENQTRILAAQADKEPYDFSWMWDELGVAHLRK